ncbi:uncharacterized protein LOC128641895 [Bombina bombina]|uniref:uncharacterized protein LOC128641895 n=1 Tax=Bombina bombina TaxID=8345 RepID=UPI00235A82E4|nr:uncharacterized protein LOC128641895 [Bombina bombina]
MEPKKNSSRRHLMFGQCTNTISDTNTIKRIKDILEQALDNLREDSFKRFKRKLNCCPVPHGYNNISWNQLQNITVDDMVDLLISHYTAEHAPKLVIQIMEDINERQAGVHLQKLLKAVLPDPAVNVIEQTPWKRKQNENPSSVATLHRHLKKSRNKKSYKELLTFGLVCDEQENMDPELMNTQGKVNHLPKSALQNRLKPTSRKRPVLQININSVCAGEKSNGRFSVLTSSSDPQLYKTPTSLYVEEISTIPTPSRNKSFYNKNSSHGSKNSPSRNTMSTSSANCPSVFFQTDNDIVYISSPTNTQIPDIKLAHLEEEDVKLMLENHKGKPQIYVRYLFMHHVPFDIYQTWTRNTNFDGSRGKNAIPKNLRDDILERVQKEFSISKDECKTIIRKAINELLTHPRKYKLKILV